MNCRALYAAYDVYPSFKGSATHIEQFSSTLFRHFQGGLLYTLGHAELLPAELPPCTQHRVYHQEEGNYLQRALGYTQSLKCILQQNPSPGVAHFRDIWSGWPIIEQVPKAPKIFEVNGLPSVELPFRYPKLPATTLKKIQDLESYCLQHADALLVPSSVTRDYLAERGFPGATVIPNGTQIPSPAPRPPDAPEQYIIYFGALQRWQGLDTAFKAFKYLQDFPHLQLVICAAHRTRFVKPYRKLAAKMGVADRVTWKFRLGKTELWSWVQHAVASLAPLREDRRNLVQGCCPLKILESMACGTAVIASDLPVIRELMTDHEHGRLVPADRPAELARIIRLLLDYPEEAARMGESGRKKAIDYCEWSKQNDQLISLYASLTSSSYV